MWAMSFFPPSWLPSRVAFLVDTKITSTINLEIQAESDFYNDKFSAFSTPDFFFFRGRKDFICREFSCRKEKRKTAY
jgi:hypothetical protein